MGRRPFELTVRRAPPGRPEAAPPLLRRRLDRSTGDRSRRRGSGRRSWPRAHLRRCAPQARNASRDGSWRLAKRLGPCALVPRDVVRDHHDGLEEGGRQGCRGGGNTEGATNGRPAAAALAGAGAATLVGIGGFERGRRPNRHRPEETRRTGKPSREPWDVQRGCEGQPSKRCLRIDHCRRAPIVTAVDMAIVSLDSGRRDVGDDRQDHRRHRTHHMPLEGHPGRQPRS